MKTVSFVLNTLLACALVMEAYAAEASKTGSKPSASKSIAPVMQKFVDTGVVAGAVTLVARDGKVLCLDTVGYSDLADKKPMKADDLFWIASMTKPITGAAILMLQEEGKLSVNDPVEKYLPEFANLWLAVERTNNRVVLNRPPRKITIRDLLTHTAGLNSDVPATGRDLSLGERTLAYALQPLSFEPGSKWQYSNPGINTLGRIVEVVSGQNFAEFLDQRFFKPLGMKDTTFWPTEAQAKRLAKSYEPASGGKGLAETPISFLAGWPLTARWRTALPAGGLFSTARDMAKFYQMMLDGGVANGKRILKAETVTLLTSTQSGDIKTGFTEGMSWGYGFQVVKQPQGVTAMLSPGTFGHGGAYGTQSWGDPKTKTIYILMIQRAKLGNSDGSEIRKTFQEAAAAQR